MFNASGPAYHVWKGVELAVSTFWPNYYQVTHTAVVTNSLIFHRQMHLVRSTALTREEERKKERYIWKEGKKNRWKGRKG